MRPEAVRSSVRLIMAKDAVALRRLRLGPSRFAIMVALGSLWRHFGITLESFLHCFASEDKSKTAFLALDGAVHADDFCPEPLYGQLRCVQWLHMPEEPFSDGTSVPIEGALYWYGDSLSPWAFAPPPVPFPGCLFWGRALPEEQLGGYIPYSLTRGYIPKAFPTTCRPNTCPLPRCGVAATLQQLPGRYSPSTSVHPAVSLSGH